MIYEQLLLPSPKYIKAIRTCEPIYAQRNGEVQVHYWRIEYVGKEGLAGILTAWYRTCRFHLWWRASAWDQQLKAFLNEEAPCIYLPRYRLISKIHITVEPETLSSGPLSSEPLSSEPLSFKYGKWQPSPWTLLLSDMESLFQLRKDAFIHIYVNFQSRYGVRGKERKQLLLKGTTPVFATLRRLKDAGYFVAISLLVFGGYAFSDDAFEYYLDRGRAEGNEDDCLSPADDADMVWR
jgi:hypothetical protein